MRLAADGRISLAAVVRYVSPMDADPRPLMLGMGWFPSTVGGLDRYYRALFEELPGARGVVIGPAEGAPSSVTAVAGHDASLCARIWSYWRAARRAGRQTDLIDAHFALYAAAPLLLDRHRKPVVFHFHGPWAEENVAVRDSSRARFRLRRALERRVLRAADEHIVLSGAFRRVLVERYGLAPWNIHVWPPGVALEEFTPGDSEQARVQLGLGRDVFVAACVRRLVPRMGIGDLLEAWASIQPRLPAGSMLLVVGEGPLAGELAEHASQAPLAGSVRMLGRVSDAELLQIYRAADIAVVPTLAVEGFGLVVLEAAACGTPSIVTDVGGLREAAAPLDASLIVPPADPKALGERLLGAASGRIPERAAVREHAERFSWPRLAERHRDLYARLAAGQRDPRVKVVFVDHVARLSGGEIALLRLLPELTGVNAHVILGEDGLLAERLKEAGISVEVLPLSASARDMRRGAVRLGGGSPRPAMHTLAYAVRLARRLRALRPDLVHANSLKSGVYGGIAARAARVPLLWHLRDRIAADYLPSPAVWMMRGLIGGLADTILANSEATLDTLPASIRERGRVIPDSVAAPSGASRRATGAVGDREAGFEEEAPGGGVTFGMLGRIAPWKGQDLFLRAFAAAFPDGQERAVLVGEPMFGELDYERELRALATQLALGERVEFRGFREDVWSELASFDVLVHASVIPEPFGQVVIEGMAAGLAVVASDEGGPAEVIEDGRTGRLFRSRDAASLAAAMKALSSDPAERHRLGEAARGAAEEYHPHILAPRLERLYEDVLKRR